MISVINYSHLEITAELIIYQDLYIIIIQWNPSIPDTLGTASLKCAD
jgi:hypothetical protein